MSEGPSTDVEISPQEIEAELDKILASPLFRRAPGQSRFLEFVVRKTLEGSADLIKEYSIGLEVFDRRSDDYDTGLDPAVRVEAGRLRFRLAEYYKGCGEHDPIQIQLPKGTYAPVLFSQPRGTDDKGSDLPPDAARVIIQLPACPSSRSCGKVGNARGVFQADAVRVFFHSLPSSPTLRTHTACDTPGYCGAAAGYSLCANRQSFSVRQTGSGNQLTRKHSSRAVFHESFSPAHFLRRSRPAECAPTQSVVLQTPGHKMPARQLRAVVTAESIAACLAACTISSNHPRHPSTSKAGALHFQCQTFSRKTRPLHSAPSDRSFCRQHIMHKI